MEDGALRARRDLPRPEPAPGEARVRVILAGICGTDLELLRGYYPFAGVPGHEFVGVVEEAPGHEAWRGRRVVGEINAACGACDDCAAGRRAHCARRTVLGIRGRAGAFAEALALPVANLHEVPAALTDEQAVFTEPLAAAFRVPEQVDVARRRVAVVGAGRLGLLLAQVLAGARCELVVAARHPDARRRLGELGIAGVAPTALPARWADVAVDCTGTPEGFALARACLRPRGTLVLKSTYAGEAPMNLSPVVVDEIVVTGSRCGPFAPALEALAAGRVAVGDLVEAVYPLARAPAAFEHAARPGVLKVLVAPAAS
jgi:threonine dehydrogenase-like Zn-dependent dehydrogenase